MRWPCYFNFFLIKQTTQTMVYSQAMVYSVNGLPPTTFMPIDLAVLTID